MDSSRQDDGQHGNNQFKEIALQRQWRREETTYRSWRRDPTDCVVCFEKNAHWTIYLCMWSSWNGKDDVKTIEYLFSVCFRVLSEVPISLWLVKFQYWTSPKLIISLLIRRSTVVHQFVSGHWISCMSWNPLCQRIFFQITFQDSSLCFDFTVLLLRKTFATWLFSADVVSFIYTPDKLLKHIRSSSIVIVQERFSSGSSWGPNS